MGYFWVVGDEGYGEVNTHSGLVGINSVTADTCTTSTYMLDSEREIESNII